MYLDSHCHLNDPKLFPRVEEIIHSARDVDVKLFLVVGWDLASSKKAIEIAEKYPNVYAAVGIHPENIAEAGENDIKNLLKLAKHPKVKAIGEIGLDYHWFKAPEDREKQKKWFIEQIDLANKLNLPISIHARDASADTLDILRSHPLMSSGVLHCYSGSSENLLDFAKLGFYFGFDGPITYKNAIEPKRNVQICPLERLLSETDSPYLAPVPFRGHDNEPKNIPLIVKEMALIKEMPVEAVALQIEKNFRTLFRVKQ